MPRLAGWLRNGFLAWAQSKDSRRASPAPFLPLAADRGSLEKELDLLGTLPQMLCSLGLDNWSLDLGALLAELDHAS